MKTKKDSPLGQLKIPPRAVIFCWRLLKNRLPTKDNLLKRNAISQEATCPLCGCVQEDVGAICSSTVI